jgi:hypothetical protein
MTGLTLAAKLGTNEAGNLIKSTLKSLRLSRTLMGLEWFAERQMTPFRGLLRAGNLCLTVANTRSCRGGNVFRLRDRGFD